MSDPDNPLDWVSYAEEDFAVAKLMLRKQKPYMRYIPATLGQNWSWQRQKNHWKSPKPSANLRANGWG